MTCVLLLLSLCGLARAADPNACSGSTTCAVPYSSGGTIIILFSTSNSVVTPTGTFTYTRLLSDFSFVDQFSTTHALSVWFAHTSGSGTDTVTETGAEDMFGRFYPASDVIPTGNPLDQNCTASGNITTSATSVNTCTLASTHKNDAILEFLYTVSNFGGANCGDSQGGEVDTPPTTGPTVVEFSLSGTTNTCARPGKNNDNGTGAIIQSGNPFSTLITFPVTWQGHTINWGVQLITLNSGQSQNPRGFPVVLFLFPIYGQ